MKILEQEIIFANHVLQLNNYRSIFWSTYKILIVSDLHLGKAAHFRKNGIAISRQISASDFDRLAQLIGYYQPEKIIIVGDMIHAENNSEISDFKLFINNYLNIKFILIKGNHDRLSKHFLLNLGINDVFDEMTIDNIKLIHEPKNIFSTNLISGHLHPGVQIKLPTKKKLKLPCFVVTDHQIILPAFSKFTGLDTETKFENAIFYAFNNDFIVPINF